MHPHVMINMAMSLDGKVSSVAREPVTFTSREDKQLLFKIRARCDALVVGARTAASDYASMGIPVAALRAARLRRGQSEHPLRVIVSGRLTLSPALRLLRNPISPILIVCSEKAPVRRQKLFARFGRVMVCGKREVDVRRLAAVLASEYGARTILCEGGPTLNDAFFRAKLVDELYLTLSPCVLGGVSAPTLADGIGFARLKNAPRARLVSCRKGKREWFLRFRFKKSE
jgi:2,5-diamino-6-(ribosylamino)-4(3H)-pyrimidinone 5'-phosphate reductase